MPPSNQIPQPQYPQQPPQDQTPYDFFMEDGSQKRGGSGLGFSSDNGPSKKILVIIAVVLGLAFAGIMLAIVLGGNKKPIPLSSVVRVQQEIIVIAEDGTKNAKSDTVRNLAITARLAMTSSQPEILAQVAKHGVKIGEKELKAATNAQATQALAAALPANTYDSTFQDIMKSELAKYDAALNGAAAAAANQQELALIKKQAASAELLQRQLNAISQ